MRRRDRRVEQGDGDAGQLDPLVAGVLVLAAVGVVVAAHDVEAVAERRPGSSASNAANSSGVPSVDRSPLTITAARSAAGHLGRPPPGSSSPGTARRPARTRRIGPVGVVVDAPGLDLAEVDVVDGAEAAAQRPGRARQRAERDAVVLVLGVGLEPVERGRRSCRRGTWRRRRRRWSARRPRRRARQTQGRARRSGIGWLHQRPLNRHTGGPADRRRPRRRIGRGHSASTAAAIAAASSSVAAGVMSIPTRRCHGPSTMVRPCGRRPSRPSPRRRGGTARRGARRA